jgi:HlyD family secretion protein
MKRTLTIIFILAILAGGAYLYQNNQSERASQDSLDGLETVEVQMGTLSATVSATGTVRSQQDAQLSWLTSGTVEQVYVQAGQFVQGGQKLAELVQTSLPQNVILAQEDLLNAQEALEDLSDSYTSLAIADAQKAIADAQDTIEDAERTLRNLQTPAPQTDIDQAYANMLLAEDELDKAEDDYKPYESKPENDLTRANYLSRLATAQEQYDDTVRTYNALRGTASATEIAIAEADLQVAYEQFSDAQGEYQRLLDGVESDDIMAVEARMAAAQATLKQAWLEAPFDGVITRVEVQTGDLVSSGTTAFQLDDVSHLIVDLTVSEVDITQVEIGQPVLLTFDAISGKEYHGQVMEVALVGEKESGVVNFDITIELLDPDDDVRPGMTTAVNIVTTEIPNVLLVHNRAVRKVDGEHVVFVVSAHADAVTSISMQTITLGATSDSYSEVINGSLQAGDSVVLNPSSDLLTSAESVSFGPGSGDNNDARQIFGGGN